MTISLSPRSRSRGFVESLCPLCRTEVRASDFYCGASQGCEGCGTHYHRDCFEEFGGCSTLGCSHRKGRASCAACWEAEEGLGACPHCQAAIHPHCLDQEGCGTRGCRNENGPVRLPNPGNPRRVVRGSRRPGPRAVPWRPTFRLGFDEVSFWFRGHDWEKVVAGGFVLLCVGAILYVFMPGLLVLSAALLAVFLLAG